MNLTELQELRREKWHLTGQPIRTGEAARAFIESVGICPMYPTQTPLLMPSFMGAYAGTDENLPTWQKAFADPLAKDATELMVRLLREKSAFEANVLGDGEEGNNCLISASAFPYFYALVGDPAPRTMPQPGTPSAYSPLARDLFDVLKRLGARSKQRLRRKLGGELTDAALDRALHELWSRLRITRVDYRSDEGAFWDVLLRWAPEPVRQGLDTPLPTALSALVSKYVEAVIAAEPADVEYFFSKFVSRAKVKDAISALLTTPDFRMTQVGNRSMLIPAARLHAMEKAALKRKQPIARRPRPGVRVP